MNASSNSFPKAVEKAGLATVVEAPGRSVEVLTSMEITLGGGAACAVKSIPVMFAPLTTTGWLAGVKVYPFFEGVTV